MKTVREFLQDRGLQEVQTLAGVKTGQFLVTVIDILDYAKEFNTSDYESNICQSCGSRDSNCIC